MSTTELVQNNLLPELALFDSTTPTVTVPNDPNLSAQLTAMLAIPSGGSNPLFTVIYDAGFGNPFLINNSARVAFALDAAADPDGISMGSAALAAAPPMLGLRKDLYTNDLRNGGWVPSEPTLMCGGENDPTVFFPEDTGTMAAFWINVTPGLITVLDVDPPAGPSGPYAAIQSAFQSAQAQELALLQTPAGGGLSFVAAETNLVENYHGSAVPPFCTLAARTFFDSQP